MKTKQKKIKITHLQHVIRFYYTVTAKTTDTNLNNFWNVYCVGKENQPDTE